jgi:N-carbamoylputrescine amidase
VKRIAVVQWPDGLVGNGSDWSAIQNAVSRGKPDILITNELPFGKWIAASAEFDCGRADASLTDHELGTRALGGLGVHAVVSSRPVREGAYLANEALVIDQAGVTGFHRKQYLPQEPGWHESTWYDTSARDFTITQAYGVALGALLCTELMFNEHARAYGRAGAELIAVPRATGLSFDEWHLAARMAALVSGCYVASSNRVGSATPGGPIFGGQGFAYAPDGTLLGVTTAEEPMLLFGLDKKLVREGRSKYPRYVSERA